MTLCPALCSLTTQPSVFAQHLMLKELLKAGRTLHRVRRLFCIRKHVGCKEEPRRLASAGGFAPPSSASSWMHPQPRNQGKLTQNIWFPRSLPWKDPPWVFLSSSSRSALSSPNPRVAPASLPGPTGKVPMGARPLGTGVLGGVRVHMGSTPSCTKSHQDGEATLTWAQRRDGGHPEALGGRRAPPFAGFGCCAQPAGGERGGRPPPGAGGEGKLGCQSPPWHMARNGLLVWCALGFYLNQ